MSCAFLFLDGEDAGSAVTGAQCALACGQASRLHSNITVCENGGHYVVFKALKLTFWQQ